MLFLISQPNCVVLEIEVDRKATGQECLTKVCQKLGIVEVDYFGLQYKGGRGELLWVNLRNKLQHEDFGNPPHRLRLRVKFYVPPHVLLQETTRYQFYLQVKIDIEEGRLLPKPDQTAQLIALTIQAEHGNYNPQSMGQYLQYNCHWSSFSQTLVKAIAKKHQELWEVDPNRAIYKFLSETSGLETYGIEFHPVDNSESALQIGVGPNGISFHRYDLSFIERFSYKCIQTATYKGATFILHLIEDDGRLIKKEFQLKSDRASIELYRAVIERHAFYSCETVRDDVFGQYIRDFKGTLASIFNENTALGKKFLFDIQRTCREAYDHAKRQLFTASNGIEEKENRVQRKKENSEDCHSSNCQELRDQFTIIQERLTCQICADAEVGYAFSPCGHTVTCGSCAGRCKVCPVCRSAIEHLQRVYLPISSDMFDRHVFSVTPTQG